MHIAIAKHLDITSQIALKLSFVYLYGMLGNDGSDSDVGSSETTESSGDLSEGREESVAFVPDLASLNGE